MTITPPRSKARAERLAPEPVTWNLPDFDASLTIGVATPPAETYFVCGAPANASLEKLLPAQGGRL